LGVVAAVEEVGAEVFVVAFVVREVPGDDQDRVADREGGLGLVRLAEPAIEVAVERAEVAVGAGDRPGRFTQRRPEGRVAVPGLAGAAFAGDSWLPGHMPAQDARWPAGGSGLCRHRSRR